MALATQHMITLRPGVTADADAIAALHTASWRLAYARILAPDWLANDVASNRQTVWRQRLAAPTANMQLRLAEDAAGLAGFVCLLVAADAHWGSHVDNLHVRPGLRGGGLGRSLMAAAAEISLSQAPGAGLDLFVYGENRAARGFYARLGGKEVQAFAETAPDGSQQNVLRVWWPDPARLLPTA